MKKFLFLKIIVVLVLLHLAGGTVFGQRLCSVPSAKGKVALTFDDGPCPQVTYDILLALAEYGAHATFFVTGDHARAYPWIVRDIVRLGHEVGNHTFDHPRLTKIGDKWVHRQIKNTQDAIYEIIERRPRFFRPPFSDIGVGGIAIAASYELTTVIWSVSPADCENPTPEIIVQKVLSDMKDGDIVVMHDGFCSKEPRPEGHPNTAEALPLILEGLKAKGLESVTLSNLCKK